MCPHAIRNSEVFPDPLILDLTTLRNNRGQLNRSVLAITLAVIAEPYALPAVATAVWILAAGVIWTGLAVLARVDQAVSALAI